MASASAAARSAVSCMLFFGKRIDLATESPTEGDAPRPVEKLAVQLSLLFWMVMRWTPLSRQKMVFLKVEKYTLVLGE